MYKNGIVQNQHTFLYYIIVEKKTNGKKEIGCEFLNSHPISFGYFLSAQIGFLHRLIFQ